MRRVIGTCLLFLIASTTSAQSLRYFGTGTNDIDRVKIKIDNPHVPADIGATDFTVEMWLRTASGNNAEYWRCDLAEQQWNYGNIIFDKSRYGMANSFGAALLSGRIAFGVRTSQGEWTTCTPASPRVDDGLWHHIALQRRASDGRLQVYIDGILRRDVDGPNGALDYPNGAQPVQWCGSNQSQTCVNDPYIVLAAEKHDVDPSSSPAFRGWIDELRLSTTLRYSGNFTPATTPFQIDGQTAALYHFDEGTGTAITDAVGQSPGVRRVGGPQNGPQWSTETPFSGGAPTDTQAPTTPGGLQGTAASSSRVDLTWTASTDNVGVTSYRVLRNGSTSFTATGTSYSDTTVTAITSYTYTVSAMDAAGNRSLESSPVQVTTPTQPVQAYRVRQNTSGYRVRAVYNGSGGTRGSIRTLAGAYGQSTNAYVDAGNPAALPTCNPNDTVTDGNGNVYMAVTGPAVSQHGLSILGQSITGYVTPCDLQ